METSETLCSLAVLCVLVNLVGEKWLTCTNTVKEII